MGQLQRDPLLMNGSQSQTWQRPVQALQKTPKPERALPHIDEALSGLRGTLLSIDKPSCLKWTLQTMFGTSQTSPPKPKMDPLMH